MWGSSTAAVAMEGIRPRRLNMRYLVCPEVSSNCKIALKCFTEHGSDTAVPCTKCCNCTTTDMDKYAGTKFYEISLVNGFWTNILYCNCPRVHI